MTLEELDRIIDCDYWSPPMHEVFGLARAMLLLKEMSEEVSLHGDLTLTLAKDEWHLIGRKPTFDVAESSPEAAIRAAWTEMMASQRHFVRYDAISPFPVPKGPHEGGVEVKDEWMLPIGFDLRTFLGPPHDQYHEIKCKKCSWTLDYEPTARWVDVLYRINKHQGRCKGR